MPRSLKEVPGTRWYFIFVWKCVDTKQYGPFTSFKAMVKRADEIVEQLGEGDISEHVLLNLRLVPGKRPAVEDLNLDAALDACGLNQGAHRVRA